MKAGDRGAATALALLAILLISWAGVSDDVRSLAGRGEIPVESRAGHGSTNSLATTPWPMFLRDPSHTGLSSYDTSANTGQLRWSFAVGSSVLGPATIGMGGILYFGSFGGTLYAVDPETGTEVWSLALGSPMYGSTAIASDGTIYAGTFDGRLHAIDPNGTIRWTVPTGRLFLSSPAIDLDGTIYVGAQDGRLYAIHPNGTVKWTFLTGHYVDASPAIGPDGTIYFGSHDNRLYALRPDGGLRWSFAIPAFPIQSSPSIALDGTIYFGAGDGNLYALNPDGTKKWSYSTGPGAVISSPAIDSDGTVYVGSSMSGYLHAVRPDGTMAWRFPTGGFIDSSPALSADGTVFVGSADYNLYAVHPNGTERWRFRTGGVISASPVISACGAVLIGSTEFYAIGPSACGQPNYAPRNANPPARVIVGLSQPLTLSVEVENRGGTAHSQATLAFHNASNAGAPFAVRHVPPVASGSTTGSFAATWISPAVAGTYLVLVDVDSGNAIAESDETDNLHLWTVEVVRGPLTSLVLGQPNVTAETPYVTSSTRLAFSVIDQSGVGIRKTDYRVNAGDWINYAAEGPFTLGSEGEHLVEWFSEDFAGNLESVATLAARVDNSPPMTQLSIGEPKAEGEGLFVTSSTLIAWSGTDRGVTPVGLDSTALRISNGGWSDWDSPRSPFRLTGQDGVRYVEYRSADRLGNQEEVRKATLVLDNTPPSTVLSPTTGPFAETAVFMLLAEDAGSGVGATEYRIDAGGWTNHSGGFTLAAGRHLVSFRSVDRLGNLEPEQTLELSVDGPRPATASSRNLKPLVAAVFAVALASFGMMSARRAPKGAASRRTLIPFVVTSLPFVLAEIATGVVSLFTGLLAIPPLWGAGMAVDLTIFSAGLVSSLLVQREKRPR